MASHSISDKPEIKLSPCPFCGGEASCNKHKPPVTRNNILFHVSCGNLMCHVRPSLWDESELFARERWNRRT